MKCLRYFPILLLAACGQNDPSGKTTTVRPGEGIAVNADSSHAFAITGERVSGTVNVKDTINGMAAFTLFNNTLVQCAPADEDWFPIAAQADVPLSAVVNGVTTLKKGQKIVSGGKITGEIQHDTTLYPSMNNDSVATVLLYGYVPVTSIQPASVIETALTHYLTTQQAADDSLNTMLPFIHSFALQKAELIPSFVHYYNYENSIDDPSPLFRVALVFHNNRLLGVVHARPMPAIKNTHALNLKRGFIIDVYNTVDKKLQEEYINRFNQFLLSVD